MKRKKFHIFILLLPLLLSSFSLLSTSVILVFEMLESQGLAMEPFEHDQEREKYYADVLQMNTIDVVDDNAIEKEMEASLKEYDHIGADLGIMPTSCKLFAEDPSRLSRWIIGEEKLQIVWNFLLALCIVCYFFLMHYSAISSEQERIVLLHQVWWREWC